MIDHCSILVRRIEVGPGRSKQAESGTIHRYSHMGQTGIDADDQLGPFDQGGRLAQGGFTRQIDQALLIPSSNRQRR